MVSSMMSAFGTPTTAWFMSVIVYAGSWWTVHSASKTRSSHRIHVLVIFCRGSDQKKTEDGKYHREPLPMLTSQVTNPKITGGQWNKWWSGLNFLCCMGSTTFSPTPSEWMLSKKSCPEAGPQGSISMFHMWGVHFNEVIPDCLGQAMWVIRSPQLRQQNSARRKTICGQVGMLSYLSCNLKK